MTIDKITDGIINAKSIVILTHEHPDGDAIGSSLAMYLALEKLGKDVDLIIPEYPRVFSFLPGAEKIKKESDKKYDLAITLDCADIKRLNGFVNYFNDANLTISIDHHIKNDMFADLNFVNPLSPATAQIMIMLIEKIGVEINKEIGTCICTGIITDTGGFGHSNVTVETFEFMAKLLEVGVNVSEIYVRVFSTVTKTRFQLMKLAESRLEFLENDKISFTYINKKDEAKIGTEAEDHEGIVDIGRCIEGVEVSIFIREIDNGYKTSLRANDTNNLNVSDIVSLFGGGGHIKASGFTSTMTIEETKEKLVDLFKKQL